MSRVTSQFRVDPSNFSMLLSLSLMRLRLGEILQHFPNSVKTQSVGQRVGIAIAISDSNVAKNPGSTSKLNNINRLGSEIVCHANRFQTLLSSGFTGHNPRKNATFKLLTFKSAMASPNRVRRSSSLLREHFHPLHNANASSYLSQSCLEEMSVQFN